MTDHPGVCDAYAPPTGDPGNSGYCARCGMHDWKHTDATTAALRLTEQEYEAAKARWVAEMASGRAHRIEILDAPEITRCRSWRIRGWRPVRCTRDTTRCTTGEWRCDDYNGYAWRTR